MTGLLAGARIAREIGSSDALAKYVVSESVVLQSADDRAWQDYIVNATARGDHPSGSCKMGSDDDPMAVVDPSLVVRGLKGLRVADAAIMPTLPSGNTNAPVMMIGERVADFIRNTNN